MTYAGPRPTYINLHSDPSKRERAICHPRAQYSTSLRRSCLTDSHDVYTLLLPSLHSQCVVVLSHKGIAELSCLPEYVASTAKSQLIIGLRRTVLNRYRRGTTSRLKLDASKESARSQFNIITVMVFSQPKSRAEVTNFS
jgi:hypothetical protein